MIRLGAPVELIAKAAPPQRPPTVYGLEPDQLAALPDTDLVHLVFDQAYQASLAQYGVDRAEELYGPQLKKVLHDTWARVTRNRDNPGAITLAFDDMRTNIAQVLERSILAGAHTLGEMGAKATITFELPNVAARTWAATRAGWLVTGIEEDVRTVLRDQTTRAVIDGTGPGPLGLRIARHIGLTPAHAHAVSTFEAAQMKAGVSPARARRHADEYAGRLREQRAQTIARTELLTAHNYGQTVTWQMADRKGQLPRGVMRSWIITPDDRLCSLCTQMRGDRALAPVNGSFAGPSGPVAHPPLHPNCRCATGLVHRAMFTDDEWAQIVGG